MYEVDFSYFVDLHTNNGNTTWIGYCSTFEKADNDYKLRLKHDTVDSQKIERIVVTKSCYIFTGKSRYQAEQALSYLKRNYPNYNNHHISGTGAWDDPYCVHMSKEIRTYDMRTKKEFICEADYN